MPGWPRVGNDGGGDGVSAVHLPDRDCAAAVLPQNIGLAVVVVVAHPHDVPVRPRLPRVAMTVVPFISQIAASPLSFCHRMSARPSPLKSPVPLACQLGPGLPTTAPPITLVPFISQIATEPSSFCHRTSEKPLPLKSPAPLTCQLGPALPILPE